MKQRTDQKKFQTLFKEQVEKTSNEHRLYLEAIHLPLPEENEMYYIKQISPKKTLWSYDENGLAQITGKRWIDQKEL